MMNILMLPNFYPDTIDDPIGSFFREQAACMEATNSVIVGHLSDWGLGAHLRDSGLRKTSFHLLDSLTRRRSGVEPPRVVRRTVPISLPFGRANSIAPFVAGAMSGLTQWVLDRALDALLVDLSKEGWVPDIIWVQDAQSLCAVAANQLWHRRKIPYVLTLHNPFAPPVESGHKARLRRAFAEASALLTVSYDKSREVLRHWPECEPEVVGNLVDGDKFAPRRSTAAIGAPNLLIVAADNWIKDLRTLVKAIELVRKKTDRAFRLTVVGLNAWSTRPKTPCVLPISFSDFCTVLPRVPRRKMPDVYRGADALILTSIQEGLPVSVLEAMASGLPIFSTRCGGVEDIVDEGSGRLVPIRAAADLAAHLVEFLEGRVNFEPGYIRNRVLARFGREAFVARMNGIFESVRADGRRNCR